MNECSMLYSSTRIRSGSRCPGRQHEQRLAQPDDLRADVESPESDVGMGQPNLDSTDGLFGCKCAK